MGRTVAASEVARSSDKFDDWQARAGAKQVCFSELPDDLSREVDSLFDVHGSIPRAWIDSAANRAIREVAPDFIDFLLQAEDARTRLFSTRAQPDNTLFTDLVSVFGAWQRLKAINERKTKCSERDYAAMVYTAVRVPAIKHAVLRLQAQVALPGGRPRAAEPDGMLFSRYQHRRNASKIQFPAGHGTPCVRPPKDAPSIECASTVWEDKRDSKDNGAAYRQNRMVAVAAVRHLASFGVRASVIGFVWHNNCVEAHINWLDEAPKGEPPLEQPCALSAPFPPRDARRRESSASDFRDFHEWDLSVPADIIELHLILRKLDAWTMGEFSRRVEEGVRRLAAAVTAGTAVFKPWKPLRARTDNHDQDDDAEELEISPGPKTRSARAKSVATPIKPRASTRGKADKAKASIASSQEMAKRKPGRPRKVASATGSPKEENRQGKPVVKSGRPVKPKSSLTSAKCVKEESQET